MDKERLEKSNKKLEELTTAEKALNYVQNVLMVDTNKDSNKEMEGAAFQIVRKDKYEKTVILIINKEEIFHILETIQTILQNKVKKYKQEFEEL